jgi:hypothetical protein
MLFDDYSAGVSVLDNPLIFGAWLALTILVSILLIRQIRKNGMFGDTVRTNDNAELCPVCGNILSKDYDFCKVCGTKNVRQKN